MVPPQPPTPTLFSRLEVRNPTRNSSRLLPQERVKLRTSNFVRIFKGSIGRKARGKFRESNRGHSQGVQKIFGHPITHIWSALRGHLCDSTAFLFTISITTQNLLGSQILSTADSFGGQSD